MAIVRNILVRVGADISALQKNLQDASKYMNKAGRQLTSIGESLTMGITLPIAAIGTGIVKMGAEFEKGMSSVKAVSGATGDEIKQLKDLAIDMGAKTKYSATEAAKGIEELLKAGVSTKDVMGGGLAGALNLAAAGEIELADAAEIASTVLNAFKKDALSVSQAADILAGAANASATDIMGLKLGLSQVSAVASGVGLSFKDTATGLAVFAQNGLKGSDAGTSLKTMLLNLQPETDKQVQLFKKLGLIAANGTSIFYDQSGKLKSLADISQILQDKLKGMTEAQRQATLKTMFGTDAIRAANILYIEGADGIKKMTTEMTKFTAAQVATEKQNNLLGVLEKLKGTLETIAVQIYNMNSGPLVSLGQNLDRIAQSFSNLSPGIQQSIVIFAALAAALGPVLWILGQVVGVFGSMAGFIAGAIKAVTAFQAGTAGLGATMTAIFGPGGVVLLAIAAVASLAAGIAYLWKNNDGFKNAIITAWQTIQATLMPIWLFIQTIAMTIFSGLQNFWTQHGANVLNIFRNLWTIIAETFSFFFGWIFDFVEGALKIVYNIFVAAKDDIANVFKVLFNGLMDTVGHAVGVIDGLLKVIVGVLKGDWSMAWQGAKQIVVNIFEGMTGIVKTAVNSMISMVNALISALNSIKVNIPSWVPGVGGKSFGINIPKIPMLAQGGIATGPTLAMVGEGREDEVIAPLSKLKGMLGSGDTLVNVYLDGELMKAKIDQKLGAKTLGMGVV